MEKMATTAFVNNVVGPLRLLADRFSMLMSVEQDSASMGRDLIMLASLVDDQSVRRACGDELRELTHDMEDCIERFFHRVVGSAAGASRVRRLAYGLRTVHIRYRFATEMKALKKRLDETHKRWLANGNLYQHPRPHRRDDHPSSSSAAEAPSCGHGVVREHEQAEHVELNPGIERELLMMLEETPVELRIIALVGFGGSGKTTLAKEVFDCPVVQQKFPSSRAARAWVDRANYKTKEEILQTLRHQFVRQGLECTESQDHESQIKDYLSDRRYLVVIDDIGIGQWNNIKSTFFEDNGAKNGSRIIVSTTLRSEANIICSNGKGWIYQMRNLESEEDCIRIVLGEMPAPELLEHSTELLKKCDGHPLSLVSAANHLLGQAEPTGQYCQEMSVNLGSLLEKDHNFGRLNSVCMDNYTSLSNHTVRACLLYLSIFPNDVPLERKVVIRRWLAEGYARSQNVSSDQSVAQENFKTFVSRGILHPIISMCKNAEVKTCKTRGIVHVFVLHKSLEERFIMSLTSDEHYRRGRHLSIDHRNGVDVDMTTTDMDLSCVRSLTIFGSAGDAVSEFHKYKILKVLDLEECNDVTDRDLKQICKLWNLRYLSLGSEITVIPKDLARLKLLETLCLRKTNAQELPVQVIGLPCLVHLIGKFKIQDDGFSRSELIELLRTSKLETLSGFVTDESQEFFSILGNMRKLRKVKIWCLAAEDGSILPAELSLAIQMYIDSGYPHRSLSIHVQGFSGTFRMTSLTTRAPRYLSSLKVKLHGGGLNTISPEVVSSFTALTEVCLSPTILTQDLLTSLSGLKFLLYVKLIAAGSNEELAVKNGAFPSLRRLCFKAPLHLTIKEGALQKLVSLQLLCRYVQGLAGIQIKHLVSLGEVTLDSNVTTETKSIWEAEASRHPNRPKILYDRNHDNF